MMDLSDYVTPRCVAAELGVPLHKVQYVLRARADELPRPSALVAQTRLYPREVVAHVRAALAGISARRACPVGDPLAAAFARLVAEVNEETRDAAAPQ